MDAGREKTMLTRWGQYVELGSLMALYTGFITDLRKNRTDIADVIVEIAQEADEPE